MPPALLSVEHLSITMGGMPVVEDVSFSISPGEMLGLVGESGCGKTVTALSVMRLIPEPPGRIVGGRILFEGMDLLTLDPNAMRDLRGSRIGMIFQEPMTSLNPVFTVGHQIEEAILLHRQLSRSEVRKRAAGLLDLVGIPSPAQALNRYPHQMSGGQRQRVMIAIALACEPKLLIADEPTTALDVTIQAQILDLIDRLRRELGMAVLIITHDLGVVAEFCDRVAVMYAGRLVEEAPAHDLFARPAHRYTNALLATIPASNPAGQRLPVIAGTVPPPGKRAAGCPFSPRCDAPLPPCETVLPSVTVGQHLHRCWNPRSGLPAPANTHGSASP